MSLRSNWSSGPITTAQTAVASLADVLALGDSPGSGVVLEAEFAYGSGGTTVTAYVQTTLDDGVTWFDVACFQFTTDSANVAMCIRRTTSQLTPVALTDGALTANTAVDGLLGSSLRVKLTTVGTYAGATSLNIWACSPEGN
jgi:hypothetical protein